MTNEQYYAKLSQVVVGIGLNIQEGQELLVQSPVASAEFVPYVAHEAYRAGARHVTALYADGRVVREKIESAPDAHVDYEPAALHDEAERIGRDGGAVLILHGEDPAVLEGVPIKRRSRYLKAVGRRAHAGRDRRMRDAHPWVVVAVPTPAWAARVFPELPSEEALERLRTATAVACRLDQPDPVAAWNDHCAALEGLSAWLDKQQFDHLEYTGPGIDLRIGLPANHRWIGPATRSENGITFVANMPTDEVFTAPDRATVEGKLRSSRPIVYQGSFVGVVEMTVESGRIIKATAEKNQSVLEDALDRDKNARYFGEVALVSEDAPVARQGLTFFDGLYDENAGCHLAFGAAYPTCLQGGDSMSSEERLVAGLNDSLQHLDFTIGSGELDVTAYDRDGKAVPILVSGRWSEAAQEARQAGRGT